jgi:hypothetical protein
MAESPALHEVEWPVAEGVAVEYDGRTYRLVENGTAAAADGQDPIPFGSWAVRKRNALFVKLSPGCETYRNSEEQAGREVTPQQLVAAAIVAAFLGHPDSEKARAEKKLASVWSHHLAIVRGDNPRKIQDRFAPTETKTIAPGVQHAAVLGVKVKATKTRGS